VHAVADRTVSAKRLSIYAQPRALRRLGVAVPISTETNSTQATQGSVSCIISPQPYSPALSLRYLLASIAMSTPAEAAKLSNAERVALEKATAACKEEAKGMKFSWHWLKHRKYVNNCIIRTAVQADPSVDIWQIRRAVNMKGLQGQRPGEWGCDPMC
jgi:hypothetical protein